MGEREKGRAREGREGEKEISPRDGNFRREREREREREEESEEEKERAPLADPASRARINPVHFYFCFKGFSCHFSRNSDPNARYFSSLRNPVGALSGERGKALRYLQHSKMAMSLRSYL